MAAVATAGHPGDARVLPAAARLGFLPFIEALRGLGIILIFLGHAVIISLGVEGFEWNGWVADIAGATKPYLLLSPLNYAWIGVEMFILISGFCIHLSHARLGPLPAGKLVIRRFMRLYPPYVVALLFFAFIFTLSRVDLATAEGWWQLSSHLLLFHNFGDHSMFSINGSFWYIAVELQLYLLYPLLLVLMRRLGWAGALWITAIIEIGLRAAAGIWWTAAGEPAPNLLVGSPLMFWFAWSMGAKLADDYMHERPLTFASQPVALLVILMVLSHLLKPLLYLSFTVGALVCATVVTRLLARPDLNIPGPPWLVKALVAVGVPSYSMYLLHEPLTYGVAILASAYFPGGKPHELILFAVCVAALVPVWLVSWGYFRLIELPSNALGRRLSLSGGGLTARPAESPGILGPVPGNRSRTVAAPAVSHLPVSSPTTNAAGRSSRPRSREARGSRAGS